MYIVGYVIKPHGIKGELKISPVSPQPERFKYLNKIYIQKDSAQTFSVERVRISKGFVYLKLSRINSRDDAEKLRGCEVLIEDSQVIDLAEDEYFIHDLVDCSVMTEQGQHVGTISDVWQNAGNDILVVRDQKNREILLPVIKDVLKSVEIENKKVIVRLLDGLLD